MVLEDGTSADVGKAMDDGDPGITQQILKQVVLKAVKEVQNVRDQQHSWEQVMDVRTVRLSRCAAEAAQAAHDLEIINRELSVFGKNQNDKSKSVLNSLIAGKDKMLLQTVMGGWVA